ncbi:MAG: hypothetical protein CUN56_05140 [Phototrophicales bacterium]|nr:MAG: hypothetical protein CUN56_05140 [Phototrophicales bacterium]RMG74090.1 MAG: hypothetical protein D6711_09485 [Chloroflexota bacterium]
MYTPCFFRYNKRMTDEQLHRKRKPAPPKQPSLPPDHIGVLIAALMMAVLGWGGLFILVNTTLPYLGPELWMFFFLTLIAISGTVLPVVRYINMRFVRVDTPPPPAGVLVRQSVWIGLFVVICAWLQILRMLSLPIMFFVGLIFVVLETFLRTRERHVNT